MKTMRISKHCSIFRWDMGLVCISYSHIGQGYEHEVDIWHTIAGHVKEGLEILRGLEMTQVL